MAKKIGLLIGLVSFSLFFVFSISAEATPSLGVIDTDLLATSGGTTPVGMDGFLFPSNGNITVWWGSNSGGVDRDVDVWILTSAGNQNTFTTVDGTVYKLNFQVSEKIDGYPQLYYGADLGTVNANSLWTLAADETAPDLTTGKNKEFYLLSGIFEGALATGDWIFAVADIIGPTDTTASSLVYNNGKDDFSPKTTSTTAVPEPSTLLLLGSGLIAVGLLGRRRFKGRG
jgi:hypothetical protein